MKTKRLINVDLLKGLAMIVMIEVHIFNEMAFSSIKSSSILLNFINGLVAPTFIFSSGFAFYLSSTNKLTSLQFFSDEFIKQLKRILFLIFAGYSLHLPYFSIEKILYELNNKQIQSLFNFDVLQCIGFGLLILLVLRTFIKNTELYINTIIIIFLLFLILTPFVWMVDFNQYLHISIATIFNNKYKSLFPIFPWFLFLFAGHLTGYYYNKYKENNVNKLVKNLLLLGILLIIICHGLWFYDPILFDTGYKGSPLFTLLRLGYLFILFSSSYILTNKIDLSRSFIITVSKESLFVYWVHLQILYRKFFNGNSLVDNFKNHLYLYQVFIASFILISVMVTMAYIWNKLKNEFPEIKNFIFYIFVITLTITFILL